MTTKSSKTTLKEVNERLKSVTIKNGFLIIEKVVSYVKITYECDALGKPRKIIYKDTIIEKPSSLSLKLEEVSYEKLKEYRKSRIPSFVLKKSGRFFYTVLPIRMDIYSRRINDVDHKCANCTHLSSAEDEDGGCAKVRRGAVGIEEYPWIIEGYETFNILKESFVVIDCLHYEKCKPRKRYSAFDSEMNQVEDSSEKL